MARYIHCPECKDKYEKSAKEHGVQELVIS